MANPNLLAITSVAGDVQASGQLLTQVATITGVPTGGSWTPYVGGVSAGAVAYNATAATLQTALRTVNAGISVTGSAGGPYTITVPIGVVVTLGVNGLTGGTGPSVVMSGIDTAIYTVGASAAAIVSTLVLTNTSSAAVAVSVNVVKSGDTVSGANVVVSSYSLAAHDSTAISEVAGDDWGAGTVLSINASTAGAINYKLTALVIS